MGSKRPPIIDGYYFSDTAVAEIVHHNKQIADANTCPTSALRIGMVFVSVPSCCNFRCPYCYTDSSATCDNERLSTAEVEQVISVSAQLGAGSVIVAGEV